ncbi:MAG: anti-sigma factor [Flavobacteriaceae bacterium]|nr:anti-sigma factor [Flavobacteriaceae bacterium]
MNAQEYIASGNLELFVYGTLSEAENKEIIAAMEKYPEVKEEVEKIETTLKSLAEEVAPKVSDNVWVAINKKIFGGTVKQIETDKATNWPAILGWAASVLLIMGLFWMFNQNATLESELVEIQNENQELLEKIISTEESLAETESLLNILRDKNIKAVNLPGHAPVAPEAFAKVFYNQNTQTVHLDARGLPEPPEGMVYQVWSLKMDPLTPTSIGLLDDFASIDNKVFVLQGIPESEGFGITLEPAGGSVTPTLEQLYTLGVI